MNVYEYIGNLHVHTTYSDGEANPAEVAQIALSSGLDFLIFTDHNLRLGDIDGYYGDEKQGYILLLAGEEVHDRTRLPQCNHLLIFGADQELACHSHNLAGLIKAANDSGGLTFIAHPDDRAVAWHKEPEIPWLDRYVEGFTGLEIWNFMSRFKDHIQTPTAAIRNVFRPDEVMLGPCPRTLALWDQLLGQGRRVVGIGSADAHGSRASLGPLSHTIFPYDFLFHCVNTHILTRFPLSGDAMRDKQLLLEALQQGRAFIGYDVPGATRGFRYSAQGQNTTAMMGEHIRLGPGITLQVHLPARAHIKIICEGEVVAEEHNLEHLMHVVREPGAYRAEVWGRYHGLERAWILSNPIYVEANPSTKRV